MSASYLFWKKELRDIPLILEGKLTINVPVDYMARYVMVLRRATLLRGALRGVGPKIETFLGTEMATSEANAI